MVPEFKTVAGLLAKEVGYDLIKDVAADVVKPLVRDVAIPALKNKVDDLKDKVNSERRSGNDLHDTINPDKPMELAIDHEAKGEASPESVESRSINYTDNYDKPMELAIDHEKQTDTLAESVEAGMVHRDGGSYSEVKKYSNGETHEVHHMPADIVSPLDRDDGPAIKMERDDHRQTASCGNSLEAREYRAHQKELIDSGDFRGAVEMDIEDIRSKFGDKYETEISQMNEYIDKLEKEGII